MKRKFKCPVCGSIVKKSFQWTDAIWGRLRVFKCKKCKELYNDWEVLEI